MTKAERGERLVASLNPAQREAVEHGPGPLLVLAGAGSGKTRVLTHRVAYMIEVHDVDPSRILAVTFTNKAAGEMRERIVRLLADRPGGIEGLWIGTFHSVCARILRRIADRFDYPRSFTIYDGDDSLQILKRVMDAMSWSIGAVDPYGLRRRISDAKSRLLSPGEYAATHHGYVEDQVAEAFRRYETVLGANKALDFDDLLLKTVVALRDDEPLLASFRRRFRHVLVDEYQDTNHAQYQLVRLLTAEHRSITVVGDDDQSIYGWRGADITNILSFEDDYPEATAIRLEQNYRSTRTILEAAHAIVEKNRERKPKKLWTDREGGEPLGVYGAADAESEARRVARTVHALQREGYGSRDIAVLYRTNAQSRALEEGMRRRGIPYVIVGGTRFYERQEIKDAMAYLRLLANPADDWSATRVLGVPKRGIGPVTLQVLESVAHERGVPVSAAIGDPATTLQVNAPTAASLAQLREILDDYAARAAVEPAGGWVAEYLEKAGLFAHYRALNDPRREDRLENLHELVAGVQAFSDDQRSAAAPGEQAAGEGDLAAFLEEVSLLTDIDQAALGEGVVTLMTLHNAKGLEFPVVFLTGCEAGLFPLGRALESPREYEEERRLFYVGLTRARDRVYLSYAHERYRWGQTNVAGPSPFLTELPEDLLEWEEEPMTGWAGSGRRASSWNAAAAGAGGDGRSRGRVVWEPVAVDEAPDDGARGGGEPASDLQPDYRPGERVQHREFGAGTIRTVSGIGRDLKVTVRFDRTAIGEKRLVARFARLEKEW
ncbi:MAG TPA: UvrD-helicase domain-containing protein [Gemmatimonadota bacterium]|nr:UvrD-helicase domain-containing protein [Gemmatimonadota bacterium]